MPNFQTIVLDTATPQLRAPGTGDGYSFDSGATNLGVWTTTGLGIGTTSPAKMLDLASNNTGITTGDPGNILRFTDTDTTSAAGQPFGRIEWYSADSDGAGVKAYIQGQSQDGTPDGNLVFATHFVSGGGLAERMRIDYAGNVGIGTSSPAVRLHVQGSAGQIMRVTDGTTGASIYSGGGLFGFNNQTGEDGMFGSTASHFLYFATNGSERARIDSSGNLGLGVTPSANAAWINFQTQRAVISGGANDRNESSFNSYRTSGQYTYIGNGVATMYQQISGQHIWYQAASGTAGNTISFTQAMTLDASGNLGVGGTSPFARIAAYVASSGTFQNAIGATNSANSDLTVRIKTFITDFYNSAGDFTFSTGGSGGTERARIPAAGGFVVGTAALATTATDGFLYIPGCAGTPTGVPTALTGRVPLVVDTTNNKLYFYSGGAWRDAGP